MKYSALTKFIFFLTIFIFLLTSSITAFAQEVSSGLAISITVIDKNAKDGNIIIPTSKGYALSKIPYDPNIFGVITENPSVFIENINLQGTKPVISMGKAYVLVSTINGEVKVNDLITTSTIPGVGQKARSNGFIVGTALESYTGQNPNKVGKILVSVNPHYNGSFIGIRTNLIQVLKDARSGFFLSPLSSFRYLVAGGITTIAFVLGFVYFGRVARSGIDSLGRNPMASKIIGLGIVLNVGLTITIIGVGLGIAYLILVL